MIEIQQYDYNSEEDFQKKLNTCEQYFALEVLDFDKTSDISYQMFVIAYCRYLATKFNLNNINLYIDNDLKKEDNTPFAYVVSPNRNLKNKKYTLGLAYYFSYKNSFKNIFLCMNAIAHEMGHIYDDENHISNSYRKLKNENGNYLIRSCVEDYYEQLLLNLLKPNKKMESAINTLRLANYYLRKNEIYARNFAYEQTQNFANFLESQESDSEYKQRFINYPKRRNDLEIEQLFKESKNQKKYSKFFERKINKILKKYVKGKIELDDDIINLIVKSYDLISFDINKFYNKIKDKNIYAALYLINNPKLQYTPEIEKDIQSFMVPFCESFDDKEQFKTELNKFLDNFEEEFVDNIVDGFENYKIKALEKEIIEIEARIEEANRLIKNTNIKKEDETLDEYNEFIQKLSKNLNKNNFKYIENLKLEIEKYKKMKEERTNTGTEKKETNEKPKQEIKKNEKTNSNQDRTL